jgi:hypothetical protein
VNIPFLPIPTKKEFHVFSLVILSAEMGVFDGGKLAQLWVKYIDGTLVFPELLPHLKEYHKVWEKSECIKASKEQTESNSLILQRHMNRVVPEDFGSGGNEFKSKRKILVKQ